MSIEQLQQVLDDIKNKYPNCKIYFDYSQIEIWVNDKYEYTYYF